MAYKCRICGANEVEHPGDVCELCAIGQDPYAAGMGGQPAASFPAQADPSGAAAGAPGSTYAPRHSKNRKVLLNGGTSLNNRDPYGNDISVQQAPPSVQVYSPGQTPPSVVQPTPQAGAPAAAVSSGPQPLTAGIAKNISVDNEKKSGLEKWFRALFSGIPFTLDDDVTMFQVFPDFSGTALNAQGNACDQVVVYGHLNQGAVSENNDVEVYGRRDAQNNIIAKTIRNRASGTTITPQRAMGPGAVWAITILVLLLLAAMVMVLGMEGIIWAVVLLLCLTNLPRVIKIIGVLFGAVFSLLKHLF